MSIYVYIHINVSERRYVAIYISLSVNTISITAFSLFSTPSLYFECSGSTCLMFEESFASQNSRGHTVTRISYFQAIYALAVFHFFHTSRFLAIAYLIVIFREGELLLPYNVFPHKQTNHVFTSVVCIVPTHRFVAILHVLSVLWTYTY